MFSRSQVLSVYPSGILIALASVLVSSVIGMWHVATSGISVPEAGSREQKGFFFQDPVLFGKKIFLESPSPISSYISLEGNSSQRGLGSQAEGNGAGSAWNRPTVSPKKRSALLGTKR